MAKQLNTQASRAEGLHVPQKKTQTRLTQSDVRTAIIIALIYMSRMLGLFLLLPVFSVAAERYVGATEFKIGLALGIYALSQAVLQIPAGILSDKIGRKPVILIGLTLFCIGSIIAALSTSIETLIVARLIQGMGAVSAACLAYIGDNVDIEKQPSMMAIVGASIGIAFILSLVLGPIINKYAGLSGIFWITAALASIALFASSQLNAHAPTRHANTPFSAYLNSLLARTLVSVYIRVFLLHLILSASFYLIPHTIAHFFAKENAGIYLYLPAALLAFFVVLPLLRQHQSATRRLIWMWLCIAMALCSLPIGFIETYRYAFIPVLTVFFFGFTYIEAMLPSTMLTHATQHTRGATSGVYTVCLFLGNFSGSLLGATLYQLDRTYFPESLNLPLAYSTLACVTIIIFLVQLHFKFIRRGTITWHNEA